MVSLVPCRAVPCRAVPRHRLRVQQRHVLGDDAVVLQRFHAPQAGAGRQMHPQFERLVGEPAVGLQFVQDRAVDGIQLHFGAGCSHLVVLPLRSAA